MTTEASSIVDISFPLLAKSTIPADSGYAIFSSLSRLMPDFHGCNQVAVHPVAGRIVQHRRLRLCPWSNLRLRVHVEQIANWIPLSGQRIEIEGTAIRLGAPRVLPLIPARAVLCRIASIKGYMDEANFRQAVRRQLNALGVCVDVQVEVQKRRTIRIRDKQVVGFGLCIANLRHQESLTVQIEGIGGRRHMGCGVFRPMSKEIALIEMGERE